MERMIVRMSNEDKRSIRQAAARLNKNMSDYLRWLHSQHIGEYPLPPAIDQKVVEGGEK